MCEAVSPAVGHFILPTCTKRLDFLVTSNIRVSVIRPNRLATNAWIMKYIFPGGLIPQAGDMVDAAKTAGLILPHTPFIHEGHQHATTLRHWRKRFNSNSGSLVPHRYDARFRRIWNFYLAASEAAFETLGYSVAQNLVQKPE